MRLILSEIWIIEARAFLGNVPDMEKKKKKQATIKYIYISGSKFEVEKKRELKYSP